MNKTTLLILIGVGVFVLLIGFIIIIRINNRKRFKKLQENLKKFRQENENLSQEDKISLPKEEDFDMSSSSDIDFSNKDFGLDEEQGKFEDFQSVDTSPFSDLNEFSNNELSEVQFDIKPTLSKSDDDFEKFMNEHSYSRKVFNKPLLEKIKKLPPDVRMLLLSNVFDRYDDDKK